MRRMNWLWVVPFLLPSLAGAQEVPPAPPPSGKPAAAAPAAPGGPTGLKRLLNRPTGPSLAAGRDEDFPDAPAAPAALPAPDEAALLRATLWAFEPAPREVRVQAIEDLGLLGDARLLNALAHMVYDPDLAAQLAAVRAVRLIRHPRAEEILVNVIRHPSLPAALKQSALEGLLFQNTRSALVFIWNVGNNPQWGTTLYGTARRLLLDVPRDAWGQAT